LLAIIKKCRNLIRKKIAPVGMLPPGPVFKNTLLLVVAAALATSSSPATLDPFAV
jgi:hypothetical protein